MSRHSTRYNKRDLNETLIVHALNNLGVAWIEAGPLDGWVWLNQWVPVEVKTPKGKLTRGQQAFVDACEHFRRPCLVWRSAEDAIAAVQAKRVPFTDGHGNDITSLTQR